MTTSVIKFSYYAHSACSLLVKYLNSTKQGGEQSELRTSISSNHEIHVFVFLNLVFKCFWVMLEWVKACAIYVVNFVFGVSALTFKQGRWFKMSKQVAINSIFIYFASFKDLLELNKKFLFSLIKIKVWRVSLCLVTF